MSDGRYHRDSATGLPITVRGTVIAGKRRGRVLGFPTANVPLSPESTLRHGVYAGWVDGRAAAVSVGVRPTYGEGLTPLIEAHILDFSLDLYGTEITIELTHRLRDELSFRDEEALKQQIAADIATVRRVLGVGSGGRGDQSGRASTPPLRPATDVQPS